MTLLWRGKLSYKGLVCASRKCKRRLALPRLSGCFSGCLRRLTRFGFASFKRWSCTPTRPHQSTSIQIQPSLRSRCLDLGLQWLTGWELNLTLRVCWKNPRCCGRRSRWHNVSFYAHRHRRINKRLRGYVGRLSFFKASANQFLSHFCVQDPRSSKRLYPCWATFHCISRMERISWALWS